MFSTQLRTVNLVSIAEARVRKLRKPRSSVALKRDKGSRLKKHDNVKENSGVRTCGPLFHRETSSQCNRQKGFRREID